MTTITRTRTQQALSLVDAGIGPCVAAKQVGMAYHVLYRALRARKERGVCPCCGVLLKPGQVAKAPAAEAAPAAPVDPGIEPELHVREMLKALRKEVLARVGDEQTKLKARILNTTEVV